MTSTETAAGAAVDRYSAFAETPGGGNPAGVVLDGIGLDEEAMRRIAQQVGYSETVYVTDGPVEPGRTGYTVRYFAPEAEVPFCGHATIALGVALGERLGPGTVRLATGAGRIEVRIIRGSDGLWSATLTSALPEHRRVDPDVLGQALACFGWDPGDLVRIIPPALAYAGAWHLVLAVRNRDLLRAMSYDFARLRELSLRHGWVTVQIAWMESPALHYVRAPFPFGGVLEDPATGAGAAAYAAYLRALGLVQAPANIVIRQGQDMGRDSTIRVGIPGDVGPVLVSGTAVRL